MPVNWLWIELDISGEEKVLLLTVLESTFVVSEGATAANATIIVDVGFGSNHE